MLSILPCLLLCEAKSREEVKGLISLQFIFIVSRCFNLLVLGGRFNLCFAVAQIPNTLLALTTTETLLADTSGAAAQSSTAPYPVSAQTRLFAGGSQGGLG